MNKEAEMYKGSQRVPGWCERNGSGIEDTALWACINLHRLTGVKGSWERIIGDDLLNTGGTTQLQRPASISQDFFIASFIVKQ